MEIARSCTHSYIIVYRIICDVEYYDKKLIDFIFIRILYKTNKRTTIRNEQQ